MAKIYFVSKINISANLQKRNSVLLHKSDVVQYLYPPILLKVGEGIVAITFNTF